MQGEHRHLDGQAGDEEGGDEQLAVGRQGGPGAGGQRPQVGGAGGGDEGEDADEHERRADRRVEDEPVPGVHPRPLVVAVPVAADEHPHRHEHELERDEEEHGVARGERRERPGLDEQEAAEEGRRGAALGHVDPRVGGDEHADDGGEEHQRHGDAVDAERPAHPEVRQPRPVDLRARHGDDDRQHERERRGPPP